MPDGGRGCHLGRRAEGLAGLGGARELAPSDVCVLLFLVGLGGDPTQLEPHAKGPGWAGHLARYYLRRLRRAELLAEADRAPTPEEVKERVCEAHGYVGLLAELDGDLARESYRSCLATGVLDLPRIRLGARAVEGARGGGEALNACVVGPARETLSR